MGDKHTILACRLVPLNTGERATVKKLGRAWPDAYFWPEAIRKLTFQSEFDKDAPIYFASRAKNLRLVTFGAVEQTDVSRPVTASSLPGS